MFDAKYFTALALLASASAFTVQMPRAVRRTTPTKVRMVATPEKTGTSPATGDVYDPTTGAEPPMTYNNNNNLWLPQRARPRRNRKNAAVRAMVRENFVAPCHFIYPLFIHDEDYVQEIPSMPGAFRHSLAHMLEEVGEAVEYGVRSFVLFPKVPDALKTNYAEECYNPSGIVPRAVSMIKDKFPDVIVCTDVALDPYSDQGHDGVVKDGQILNDETIGQLCKQAVAQARAGSDVVAPSDMMDGRVMALRDALDSEGFTDVHFRPPGLSLLAHPPVRPHLPGVHLGLHSQVRFRVLRALSRRLGLTSRVWRQKDLPAGPCQRPRGPH